MSRDELLVLRRELTDLLDKGFIRVSHSPAAAPVLFVRKPGGGLRFCVDYRALNKITRKDRYPIPLIQETLNQVSRAKWYTKLDVSAAFHKLRIAAGDEWKTAFRTRFGLYEWLVTPFGLANAPSSFQRYINYVLREYLDDFVSVYLDDILIFTSGSRQHHRTQVKRVLESLQTAGLYLDIDKCEFEVRTVKYVGFILDTEKGIRMDPEKIKAVRDWKTPTTLRGLRAFLGFANFYRKFIAQFSQIARPLTDLTKKNTKFYWSKAAETAFQTLKELFVQEPILAQFDPDRETIVETDSAGYSYGGALSQVDDNGDLRPVAYYSAKMTPEEANYEIHDKELLAIIRCLEQWDAELRSVRKFSVLTDHKNLEYFKSPRKLSERHVRWSYFLERFDMTIQYRPGRTNVVADALSRREQDIPQNPADKRISRRTFQLLRPDVLLAPIQVEDTTLLADLWDTSVAADLTLRTIKTCLEEGRRRFPPALGLRVSTNECSIDDDGHVLFRERKWVPDNDRLRTKLVTLAHSTPLTGHPGKHQTYRTVAQQYFWPGMATFVRRFVRNCDLCNRTKPWRQRAAGFLRPLPLPERIWQELSIDFIEDLPLSRNCRDLMVVTDRLGRGIILIPLEKITAENVARAFVRNVYRHHGLPRAIVTDRGSQFTGDLWKTLYTITGIE